MSFELINHSDAIDEILDPHRTLIGAPYDGYRGHAYRMFNYVRYQLPGRPELDDRVAAAAAFHDLPIVMDWNVDYIVRAADLAATYVRDQGHPEWIDDIRPMIENHHKIRTYRGPSAALAEATRRADWLDVSFGTLRFGIPRQLVKEVSDAFPVAGFYPTPSLGRVLRYAVRHPHKPLPMMRW